MSPFRSKAQRAYLHAHRPDIAARWEGETPKGAKLPAHAPKATPRNAHKRPKTAQDGR
jgi:hypothetical protein